MENQLRCVMFNREEFLIEHQLDADVLFLLEGLYQYCLLYTSPSPRD